MHECTVCILFDCEFDSLRVILSRHFSYGLLAIVAINNVCVDILKFLCKNSVTWQTSLSKTE